MECDSCADDFCLEISKMQVTVYEYMSQIIVIWCSDPCTTKTKMKLDLNKTVSSLKTLVDDFYYIMNGTKVKGQAASQTAGNFTF